MTGESHKISGFLTPILPELINETNRRIFSN